MPPDPGIDFRLWEVLLALFMFIGFPVLITATISGVGGWLSPVIRTSACVVFGFLLGIVNIFAGFAAFVLSPLRPSPSMGSEQDAYLVSLSFVGSTLTGALLSGLLLMAMGAYYRRRRGNQSRQ